MSENDTYYSQLLSAYNDGYLSETEQQLLFAELARNSALREELSQSRLLRSVLKSDKAPIPSALRTRIQDAVMAAALVPHTQENRTNTPATSSRYRNSSLILSFVCGMLLMYALTEFTQRSRQESNNSELRKNNSDESLSNRTATLLQDAQQSNSKSNSVLTKGEASSNVYSPSGRAKAMQEARTEDLSKTGSRRSDRGSHAEKGPLILRSSTSALLKQPSAASVVSTRDNHSLKPSSAHIGGIITTDEQGASVGFQSKNTTDPLLTKSSSSAPQTIDMQSKTTVDEEPNATFSTDAKRKVVSDAEQAKHQSGAAAALQDERRKQLDGTKNYPYALELRVFSALSFPQVDLPGLIDPPINNVAIGVQKRLNERWAVGIEFGQETILQRFVVVDGDSRTEYQQNHLGFWLGARAEYRPFESSTLYGAEIQAVLRSTVGATRMGPMLRPSAGLSFGISPLVDINLLLESTFFAYQQADVWNLSTKLGTSLGLQVHF